MRYPIAVLLLISCFFVKLAQAQSNELLVLGQTGNLHLEHTVVAKENWYSVGRLYNLTPKDLTTYNKLTLGQPLVIGQTLEIPLTAVNFAQNGQKAATETLVPVYHIVQEKEWMYRVSVNHNKVPIPSLEKWNNINKDQVHAGMHLVVGYLRVKTALSALAKPGGGATGVTGSGVAGSGTTPVATGGSSAAAGSGGTASAAGGGEDGSVAGAKEGASGVKDGDASGTKDEGVKGVKDGGVSPVKDGGVKEGSVSGVKDGSVSGVKEGSVKGGGVSGTQTAKANDTKKAEGGEGGTAASGGTGSGSMTASNHNGGIFKTDFSESGKSASGAAGTFKSTSGWQDGKYYALMNNIAVGTIVKVNDGNTGKTIYAKVLGALPDMKESAGLTIRISNAAASELGEGEGRFNVNVSY